MRVTKKGFIGLELLLILLIAVLLAGTGWYVLKAKDKASNTYSDADAANSSQLKYNKAETTQKDPTADWVAYSSKEEVYSLKYPKTWTTASNPEFCSPGLLLLGGNAKSVGKCPSEYFGQISVASSDGNSVDDQKLSTGYKDVTTTNVTVAGVSGIKMVGTVTNQDSPEGPGALANGTKVTKYIFFSGGKTYTATYVADDSYTNVLSDFDLMVTETLKFTSQQ